MGSSAEATGPGTASASSSTKCLDRVEKIITPQHVLWRTVGQCHQQNCCGWAARTRAIRDIFLSMKTSTSGCMCICGLWASSQIISRFICVSKANIIHLHPLTSIIFLATFQTVCVLESFGHTWRPTSSTSLSGTGPAEQAQAPHFHPHLLQDVWLPERKSFVPQPRPFHLLTARSPEEVSRVPATLASAHDEDLAAKPVTLQTTESPN